MKRATVLFLLGVMLALPARAEIYTLYSDNGLAAGVGYDDSGGLSPIGSFVTSAPEGFNCWKVTPNGSSSYDLYFYYASPQNLSRFKTGELRVWINTDDINMTVRVNDNNGTAQASSTLAAAGWTAADAGKWKLFRLPLAGATLTSITGPFVIVANPGVGSHTLLFDDVRYVDSTTSPIFNVKLCNANDASCTANPTQITWTGATAASSWVKADQYIQLSVDPDTTTWGVQIYTDNTAVDANPKFATTVASGNPGSNPAGLVDGTDHSQILPIAWSIHADTYTTTATAGDPNSDAEWFYMQDKATPQILASNTAAFANGATYINPKDNQGIQYNPTLYGAVQVPPNPIYLEANYSTALGGRTYQTTTLRVEYYYP